MAQVRVIKKYPNRRLYDTEISSYITLEEVRQLVVDGEEFEVRDAKSGDSLQGFMGGYLERSLQVFLDQQQQFRSQLNTMMGQTPWSMLNDLTERNMDMWKSLQQGFLNAASSSMKPPGNGNKDKS